MPDVTLRRLFSMQKRNAKARSLSAPSYSFEEFEVFCLDNGFNSLYSSWREAGFDKWSAPSVDRIDNHKSYDLDNIRLVTWRENHTAPKGPRR